MVFWGPKFQTLGGLQLVNKIFDDSSRKPAAHHHLHSRSATTCSFWTSSRDPEVLTCVETLKIHSSIFESNFKVRSCCLGVRSRFLTTFAVLSSSSCTFAVAKGVGTLEIWDQGFTISTSHWQSRVKHHGEYHRKTLGNRKLQNFAVG